MREILFRGKRADDGKWKFGHYDSDLYGAIIRTQNGSWAEINYVDPETVGQFTGLTDKNGKKIFEGDILEEKIRGRPLKDGTPGYKTRKYIVRFGGWSFYLEAIGASGRPSRCVERCKIIGNIHDNPELLDDSHGK